MNTQLSFGSIVALLLTTNCVYAFSGAGSGSQEDPYQVTTCVQLQEMNDDLAADYILVNDVDCSETMNWNGGSGFEPIGGTFWVPGFRGTLDGRDYKVMRLFINRGSTGVGLFGRVLANARIENIGLEDIDVNGSGGRTGGLAGQADNCIIQNSYVTGSVRGSEGVGGLVGNSDSNLTVSRSYSSADVTLVPGSFPPNEVGGLIGYISSGSITDSYATGTVVGLNEVGGLVGWSNGPIENSYSTGSVSGNTSVGGLVGFGSGQPILNSYWDIERSGQSTSAGGIGKATAEMKQQSTFAGWDFGRVWRVVEGVTYPSLQWSVDSDGDGVPDSEDDFPQGRFTDAKPGYWSFAFIEAVARSGITGGCGPSIFCPDDSTTRAQVAVFLERGMNGSSFTPPPATGNTFLDVGADDFAASFIEQLYLDGITGGCGGNNYCPSDSVTRAQMAVFLLRAKHGAGYTPPPPTGVFPDADLSHWAVSWIEQLAAEGITSGCGGGNYCPEEPVTRAQLAVFLVRTFGL